jgi:hypothetical protein
MTNRNIDFEKPSNIEAEKEPVIQLIGSSQAPEEYKENPLYNSYHWGMADWEENKLYVPDNSDEAISFSIASHELGHLVNKGRIQPDRENFQDTYQEELRAWEVGWKYLERHLADYYNDAKSINDLKDIEEKVKGKMIEITLLTEPFYQNPAKKDAEEQRNSFLQTEQGKHIKAEINGLPGFIKETLASLGQESFLKKTDWNKFSRVIKKTLIDIEKDNQAKGFFESQLPESQNKKGGMGYPMNPDNFTYLSKNNLINKVNLFIADNQNYTPGEKEGYKRKIEEAINLALEIHKDQRPRPDGPYINHILRVSQRIVEDFGIKDPELVIAALLHDSVEDQAKKLAQFVTGMEAASEREKALLFIKNTFGQRVERIVSKLSNPGLEGQSLSAEEENVIYEEHVKEAIKDIDVLPVKLADFLDNTLNWETVEDRLRFRWSKKYLPVMEIFLEKIDAAKNILSPEKIIEIKNHLSLLINQTEDFIKNQEKR